MRPVTGFYIFCASSQKLRQDTKNMKTYTTVRFAFRRDTLLAAYGEWRMANGEWRMASGERRVARGGDRRPQRGGRCAGGKEAEGQAIRPPDIIGRL